ncbi:MAG TPA: carboxymuconolactone decarboxylase family protein [Gammaproteobacteria bacterium]|nr:carboxymuconolactone decarboxylase family protein [Gammaproteobacteria bacterium]
MGRRGRKLPAALLLAVAALAALAAQVAAAAPRLAPLSTAALDDAQRALTTRFSALGMRNAIATYARYPALASAMLPYTEFLLTKSTLPPRHRELLWLRTAWLARSDYLWAQRAPAARRAGLTDAELTRVALGPDAPGWDAFEAALLRAADELHVDAFVSDATWAALAARYDANQLTDLVYGVGEIALHAAFANTLRIEIEPELADRLPSGVAYAPAARQTNARLVGKAPRIEPLAPTSSGPSANVFRTFARNPPADELRNAVGRHIRDETSLAPRNRQQLIMRVGVLCRSEYEWAAHSRIGRQVGMNDADVARVVAGPAAAGGSALETALLRAADELYRDDAIGDATWDALAKELSERQLLDALLTVGGYRSATYAINSAGVQLDANMSEFRFPPALR